MKNIHKNIENINHIFFLCFMTDAWIITVTILVYISVDTFEKCGSCWGYIQYIVKYTYKRKGKSFSKQQTRWAKGKEKKTLFDILL